MKRSLKITGYAKGFTIVELLVAASIMIVLCVGLLTVFSYTVKINRGENIRIQAQSVLQQELEYYRNLTFGPGNEVQADLDKYRTSELYGDTKANGGKVHTRPARTSADGKQSFNIKVTITNLSYSSTTELDEAHCTLKEIKVEATLPVGQETGWLSNLQTNVTMQRVRSN